VIGNHSSIRRYILVVRATASDVEH
jgi:hypothetical protein